MEYKAGQKVKFLNPMTEAEKNLVFTVVEDRDNRVLVQGQILGWKIQPTFVYLKTDLEVING